MQPIILLGVAVAAVALVSTGFLSEPWNQFDLWVQQLGWGENSLDSPISHATVDLEVKKIVNDNGTATFDDDYFDNVIQSCSFHSGDNIAPALGNVINEGVIICKMLDDRGLAIAEGKITIPNGYDASSKLFVPISQCITENGVVSTPDGTPANCLDVQTAIHQVKLVVEGPLGEDMPPMP